MRPVGGGGAAVGLDALILDVGGVIFVPDHSRVVEELSALGVNVDAESLGRAHYHGMWAVDTARSEERPADIAGSWGTERIYVEGMASALDSGDGLHGRVVEVLAEALRGPACEVWQSPVPGSLEAVATLGEKGFPLAVVSNSDGTVEEKLRSAGVCQVGKGTGVSVAAVVDSTVMGVWKPDPGIFRPALEALGADAARTAYVGDSVHYDVGGARSAGLIPLHFDPVGLCTSADHAHVSLLAEVVASLDG